MSKAQPLRSYLADRAAPAPDLTDERTARRQERATEQDAANEVFRKTPFWVHLIPFGTQIKSENARNAAGGKSWTYTAAQIFGALLLYYLLSTLIGPGMIRL